MVSMRAKRCMWLLGGLVALCVCAAWLYQSAYPIAPDRSNAAECIQDFYLHGSTAEPPVVKLYDDVTLGDRTYVLLELGENLDLGRAILERSLTGRYRVAGLGYGGGSFRDEIVETDGRKYLLLGGRNTGEQITCATFTLDGTAYQTEIPRQSRFLVCTEVDSRTEASHLDLETLTWYNAQGKEVAVDYIRPISGR